MGAIAGLTVAAIGRKTPQPVLVCTDSRVFVLSGANCELNKLQLSVKKENAKFDGDGPPGCLEAPL